jgi:hypothetical protein
VQRAANLLQLDVAPLFVEEEVGGCYHEPRAVTCRCGTVGIGVRAAIVGGGEDLRTLEALEFNEKSDVGTVEDRRDVEVESSLPNEAQPT